MIFDWDEEGFQNYLADPEVPAIIKAAGHSASRSRRCWAASTARRLRRASVAGADTPCPGDRAP